MILKDILGLSTDFNLLDKTLDKIKKQINLQTNKIPLIGDELDSSDRDQKAELTRYNHEFVIEIQAQIEKL
jgi:hypothetical protein